jgi:hypothetical protein
VATSDHEVAICPRCPHPEDPHALIATGRDPSQGGIMLCPYKDCQCFGTWSVPQLGSHEEDVWVPDEATIQALRKRLQANSLAGAEWSDLE